MLQLIIHLQFSYGTKTYFKNFAEIFNSKYNYYKKNLRIPNLSVEYLMLVVLRNKKFISFNLFVLKNILIFSIIYF